jgi:hypothetical protein
MRLTSQGAPVIVPERLDEEIIEILRTGGTRTMTSVHDLTAYRIAALKHVYLAACLWLRAIPEGGSAERISGELLAVRDAPVKAAMPISAEAGRLRLGRTYQERTGAPLALHTEPRDEGEPPSFMVSLAGTVLVSWPLDDISPFVHR